ncbi:MAG: COQ9 family protein [Pseudomonadota bacterium]
MTRTPSQTLKDQWLSAVLSRVPDYGWTKETLAAAADEAGLDDGEQVLAAPGGVNDLIDHFFGSAADKMLEQLATEDLGALRVHERVAVGLRMFLDQLEPNREAVRRAAARGMMPWGAGAAASRIWDIADAVWEGAGDTATDYNRQTKRALLSAVIPSVVSFWLANKDSEAINAHIKSRLQIAMMVGKSGGKLAGPMLKAWWANRKIR